MSDMFALSSDVEVQEPRGTYDSLIVAEVWDAADQIPGNDPGLWRKDDQGNTICRSEYGNRNSSFGWEIKEEFGSGGALKPVHIDFF